MDRIIPGILEKSWTEVEKKIETAKVLNNTIHIDIIDGVFANNQTYLDPKPFSKYADELFLEAHLMVSEPLKFLEPFAEAGFKRFIGHVEKMTNVEEFVAQGQLLGEVGLALDIDTEIEKVKISMEDLDCVLLMGTKAGQSGQKLQDKIFEKISKLSAKTFIPIEVDGGVNDENILKLKELGAQRFVATSFIFEKNPLEAYKTLSKILDPR